MLKCVAFLLDYADRAGEAAKKAVDETCRYIKENGIDAFVSDGSDPLPLSTWEYDKGQLLILTDSGSRAKELSEKGYYCVGLLHADNDGENFPGLKYIFSDIEEVDMDSFVKVYQRYAGEPWEVLETQRLIIRETTLEDVDEFYRIYADPEMTRYMEGLFEDPADEKRYQKDYIEKVYGLMGFGVWTLVRKEDGRIIGRAGYSVRNGFDEPELGFLVGKEFQRKGYCLEALRAILEYGRDVLQFDRVQALVKAENEVSIHVLKRLGFTEGGDVDVEENIYGDQYSDGQRVSLSGASYGKYVRMIFLW